MEATTRKGELLVRGEVDDASTADGEWRKTDMALFRKLLTRMNLMKMDELEEVNRKRKTTKGSRRQGFGIGR